MLNTGEKEFRARLVRKRVGLSNYLRFVGNIRTDITFSFRIRLLGNCMYDIHYIHLAFILHGEITDTRYYPLLLDTYQRHLFNNIRSMSSHPSQSSRLTHLCLSTNKASLFNLSRAYLDHKFNRHIVLA